MDLFYLFHALLPVVADSDSDNASGLLPLLLALSGFIFYMAMYSRYRNADKRHAHEKATNTTLANLQCTDVFIKSRKKLKNAKMQGANHARVEGALNVSGGDKLKQLME